MKNVNVSDISRNLLSVNCIHTSMLLRDFIRCTCQVIYLVSNICKIFTKPGILLLLFSGDTNRLWTLATLVLILTIVMGGVYLVFRHWRLSRDMDTLLWRIDKKDISWESGTMCPFVGGRACTGSQASLARFSTLFAPLVQYRERHFAAKAISIGQLDNNMKHQLKLVSS